MKTRKPNLYQYSDYRKFLRDFYSHKKAQSPHLFSFRIFSERASLGSPNYFKLIMEGKRNLSKKMILRFADALKLEAHQKQFFENLVLYTQATAPSEKEIYFKNLLRFREYRMSTQIQNGQQEYLSKWYHIALRELVALQDFQEDPKWIASKLNPPITRTQAKQALQLLLNLGLLKRTEQGKLEQTDPHLKTDEVVSSLSAYQFHKQMIEQALQALNQPCEEREISSITLALPKSELPALKKKLYEFLYDLQQWLGSLKINLDEIYQLNFQLFGLTQSNQKKEKL